MGWSLKNVVNNVETLGHTVANALNGTPQKDFAAAIQAQNYGPVQNTFNKAGQPTQVILGNTDGSLKPNVWQNAHNDHSAYYPHAWENILPFAPQGDTGQIDQSRQPVYYQQQNTQDEGINPLQGVQNYGFIPLQHGDQQRQVQPASFSNFLQGF